MLPPINYTFGSLPIIGGPIRYDAQNITETVVLRDVIIDGAGDCAIEFNFPQAWSSIWPTLIMQNVIVRGRWRKALRLTNGWNANIIDCYAAFHATGNAELAEPMEADIAFDLYNSMDVQMVRPRVNGYKTGIYVKDLDNNGHAEGLHVHGGWLMNVDVGIEADGFGSGGWPTPHLVVDGGVHIAHNKYGVWAKKYTGVQVTDCNIYGTHWSGWPLGVVVEDCWDVRLSNHHWINRHPEQAPAGCGIVVNRSKNVLVNNNTVNGALAGSLVVVNSERVTQTDNCFIPPVFGV